MTKDNFIDQNERNRLTPEDEQANPIIDFKGKAIPFEDARYFYMGQFFKPDDSLEFLTNVLGAQEVPF